LSASGSLPPALAEVLEERFGARLASAEKLEGGLCNTTWKLATVSGPIAVRLGDASALQLGADRGSEVAALEAASPISPAVLLADPEAGWLVTEWIPGRHWTREEAREPDNLRPAGLLLARLHACRVTEGVRRLTLRSALLGLGLELDFETRSCLAALEYGAVIGLCHNDPHHRNILVDEAADLRLVDWEYAAIGEVVVDLAEYANVHELDDRDRALLLDAYRAAGGRVSQVQFEAARRLCRLRTSLWESGAAKKQS